MIWYVRVLSFRSEIAIDGVVTINTGVESRLVLCLGVFVNAVKLGVLVALFHVRSIEALNLLTHGNRCCD